MSLPCAARGLKIPYVVRNDWQSRGLTMAATLTCYKKLAKPATWDNLLIARDKPGDVGDHPRDTGRPWMR